MLITLAAKVMAAQTAAGAPLAVPDPSPVAPPGSEDFIMVLNWVLWIALGAGVLGFTIVGIRMMLQSQGRMGGGGSEAMAGVGWVAVGCIVVAAAAGLVRTFT